MLPDCISLFDQRPASGPVPARQPLRAADGLYSCLQTPQSAGGRGAAHQLFQPQLARSHPASRNRSSARPLEAYQLRAHVERMWQQSAGWGRAMRPTPAFPDTASRPVRPLNLGSGSSRVSTTCRQPSAPFHFQRQSLLCTYQPQQAGAGGIGCGKPISSTFPAPSCCSPPQAGAVRGRQGLPSTSYQVWVDGGQTALLF